MTQRGIGRGLGEPRGAALALITLIMICIAPGSAYYFEGDVHPPDTLGNLILTEEARDSYCTGHGLYPPDGSGGSNYWELAMGPTSTYVFNTYLIDSGYSNFNQGSTLSTTREKLYMKSYCSPYPNGSQTFSNPIMYVWCNKGHSNYTGCVAGADSETIAPVSSFSCNPTSQYPDQNVVCTDTSTNTPTSWAWSIDAESFGIDGYQTHTGQNFTWSSHYPGFYSVNLQATNSAGSDWENKTNYILISVNATPDTCEGEPLAGLTRTKFRCMNPANDATILGCNIQLQDIQGGAWSNQSSIATGIWCIDTEPGHFINAYSDATGYTSGSRLNVQEWDHMQYTIPLIPGYSPPPPAGNVSIYVYVRDFSNYAPVSGASVTVSGYGLPTKSGITNSAGSSTIIWPNVSTAYINVAKAGYTTGAKVITTTSAGPDIVYVDIHKGTLTATLTPTPGPGGTTYPTVGPTIDPRSNAEKDAAMMDQIRNSAEGLINLAILATIFGLVGLIAKSMK